MPRKVYSEVRIKGRIRTSDYFVQGTDKFIGQAVVNYNMEGANNVQVFSPSGELLTTMKSQVDARQFLYDNYLMTEDSPSANS
jgi:hypothetical protein